MTEKRTDIDPALVEAIALRVVELLGETSPKKPRARLVDASTVAQELDVERDWVYTHANDLGAIRLGGPRGRLRFDLQVVRERLGGAEPEAWRPARRQARRASVRTVTRMPLRPSARSQAEVS